MRKVNKKENLQDKKNRKISEREILMRRQAKNKKGIIKAFKETSLELWYIITFLPKYILSLNIKKTIEHFKYYIFTVVFGYIFYLMNNYVLVQDNALIKLSLVLHIIITLILYMIIQLSKTIALYIDEEYEVYLKLLTAIITFSTFYQVLVLFN